MQLAPPQATPYAPPAAPQSQMLAQVLASMKDNQPQTAASASANTVANALNTFGAQAAGQGGQYQWTGGDGKPSGNWFDSPLGSQVGGMFGLGKTAQGNQMAQSVYDTSQMAAPAGAGQIMGGF